MLKYLEGIPAPWVAFFGGLIVLFARILVEPIIESAKNLLSSKKSVSAAQIEDRAKLTSDLSREREQAIKRADDKEKDSDEWQEKHRLCQIELEHVKAECKLESERQRNLHLLEIRDLQTKHTEDLRQVLAKKEARQFFDQHDVLLSISLETLKKYVILREKYAERPDLLSPERTEDES